MVRGEAISKSQMELIRAQIFPGETLCWVGQEPRSRYLWRRLFRIALFALITCLMGLLAAMMILMNPDFLHFSFTSAIPVLTPLLLAAAGGFLLGREILRPQKRAPDLYALTNRRGLVITIEGEVKFWRYDPQAARSIQIHRHRDGSGDIIFERSVKWGSDEQGRSTRRMNLVAFYGLPDVDEVLCQLKQIEPSSSLKIDRR